MATKLTLIQLAELKGKHYPKEFWSFSLWMAASGEQRNQLLLQYYQNIVTYNTWMKEVFAIINEYLKMENKNK